MKTNHTPGPWTIDRLIGRISGGTYPSIVGFRVPCSQYEHETAEVEANARLIAAAPEMLEALEEIISTLDSSKAHSAKAELIKDPSMSYLIQALNLKYEIAKKAIAKAKGE